jgi:predicted DNA binding CopG/RHH family protein
MAKRKVKVDASPEATPALTNQAKDRDQSNHEVETSVPAAAVLLTVPSTNSIVTPEPVAEKPTRAAKKAAKSKEAIEPVVEEPAPVAKKAGKEKEQASEKAVKMKRLTLDIPKPLHKAIKAQAVEEGSSIVDMLRTLLEKHYSK